MPNTTLRSRDLWLFFAFAAIVLAAGIGLRDPWPADEPRFVLVARQMWESGDWLFPHRGRELYADKPPLYFWLLDAAYALVRNWKVAFLLPSLLAGLGTLALTYDLGRRLWDRRIGLWAAGAVLCALQFGYQAKRAQIDPTVVFFITLSIYGLGRHLLLGPAWRWYYAACAAAALGVISKGVGFLALLALLPYAWMRWRGWNGLATPAPRGAGRWTLGLAVLLGTIGLWLVPMLLAAFGGDDPTHRAYANELLFRQTATRYVDAWHHTAPPWYFAQTLLVYWLPFSIFFPWLIGPWRDAWRARDARVVWPLLWAVLVVLFFSASPGKRDMYILPALPAFALAAAPYLPQLAERRGVRAALLAFALLLGAGLAIAGGWALFGQPAFKATFAADRGLESADAQRVWTVLTAMGATVLAAALWGRLRHAVAVVAMTVATLWLGYAVGLTPLLNDESSARGLMREARAAAGEDNTIGLVAWTEQQLLQAVGPTVEFGFKAPVARQWNEGLAWLREAPVARRLLIEDAALPDCVDRAQAQSLGVANRRRWWLLGGEATIACRTGP